VFAKHRDGLDRAQQALRNNDGHAVFLARFTAFLRAVVPGTARMPYPRFLAFNAAGGVVWATGFTLLGYVAGASYHRVEKIAGRASAVILVLVILTVLIPRHPPAPRRTRPVAP
jgi:membrane-associated protein